MYSTNETLLSKFSSPVRSIKARVELWEGSTLVNTFNPSDALISIHIERAGEEGKFFGFGFCQKLNIHLLDLHREINISTANSLKIYFEDVAPFPMFYVTEVNRDENNNELSITAYDILKDSTTHTVSELSFAAAIDDESGVMVSYTLAEFVEAAAALFGLTTLYINLQGDLSFQTYYAEGANFEGTESIRDALTAAAEATQTIYYVSDDALVFKRLDRDGEATLNIDKEQYIDLDSKTNRRLVALCSVTDLGDNIEARLEQTGTTQYLRDNPFLVNRADLPQLLDNALTAVGGFVINQFECQWRGNPLLELGDKIALTTKDNDIVSSFVLNDTLDYDGGLSQKTSWTFGSVEAEVAATPSTVGELIKQTYAKVDKVNKTVELVASEVSGNSQAISSIKINTDDITQSVKKLEERQDAVTGEIQQLTQEVSTKMTKEDLTIEVEKQLENGVDKITTITGFTFNEDGLTVSKTDSEMSTQITEDGMSVSRNDEEVLIVNNEGVKAEDLHATTYLIVGKYSRFEDYGDRTGCFWIGQ